MEKNTHEDLVFNKNKSIIDKKNEGNMCGSIVVYMCLFL